jgi:integrase
MNPKTLQYMVGHSDIGVTMNTYTHLGLEDAAEEMRRIEELKKARAEMDKLSGKERKVKQSVN